MLKIRREPLDLLFLDGCQKDWITPSSSIVHPLLRRSSASRAKRSNTCWGGRLSSFAGTPLVTISFFLIREGENLNGSQLMSNRQPLKVILPLEGSGSNNGWASLQEMVADSHSGFTHASVVQCRGYDGSPKPILLSCAWSAEVRKLSPLITPSLGSLALLSQHNWLLLNCTWIKHHHAPSGHRQNAQGRAFHFLPRWWCSSPPPRASASLRLRNSYETSCA